MTRLVAEMAARGMNQAQLARASVLNESTVSAIISGGLRPGKERLRKLASALGYPVERATELLDEVEG